MKIIINYTGEGIQPYSIEFELDENEIPKTDADWKKLILSRSNDDSSNLIEICTWSVDPSDNFITANVVLSKLDRLSNLPPEALEQILTKLSWPELIADRRISRYLAKQISLTPLGIFIQSTSNWRLSHDEIEQAIKPLKHPENIKRLLELVDIWLKTQQGIERFLAWIDTFRNHFVAVYNSLATPRSAEHEALFALITDNVESLNLNELNSTAQAIALNYSAVAASLNAMRTFLAWLQRPPHVRGNIPSNWHNTGITCYCNLRGANLQRANLQEANLLGGANFRGANLQGANLQEANLLGGANFQRGKSSRG